MIVPSPKVEPAIVPNDPQERVADRPLIARLQMSRPGVPHRYGGASVSNRRLDFFDDPLPIEAGDK